MVFRERFGKNVMFLYCTFFSKPIIRLIGDDNGSDNGNENELFFETEYSREDKKLISYQVNKLISLYPFIAKPV